MTIKLKSGKNYSSQIDDPKGSIENPMSDEELRGKFEALAVPVVGVVRASRIADMVMRIERCSNIGDLMRLTVPSSRKSQKKKSPHRR